MSYLLKSTIQYEKYEYIPRKCKNQVTVIIT